MLGTQEVIIVGLAVIALLFGPKKIPELARSLGEAKKEFIKSRKEADELTEEVEETVEEATKLEDEE